MDDSIAAYAALAVSLVAMTIATAQVLQQYLITGQLIRLCDSVVFGDLPGQGRRIWQFSQFRFRVVYEIPQIGLPPDIWPSSAAPSSFPYLSTEVRAGTTAPASKRPWHFSGSGSSNASVLPFSGEGPSPALGNSTHFSRLFSRRTQAGRLKSRVGEASWASFCRTVHYSCHAAIGFDIVMEDADRCPYDLPSVPMQASLRDLAVMALMAGLECTAASFETGSISMQGTAGTITSSQHPVLGPTVHFATRRSVDELYGIGSTGQILKSWLWRIMGNCIVAGRQYNWQRRRAVEKETGNFVKGYRDHKLASADLVLHHREDRSRPPKPANSAPAHNTSDNANTSTSSYTEDPLQSRGDDGLWQIVEAPVSTGRRNISADLPQPDFDTVTASYIFQKVSRKAVENTRRTWTRFERKYLDLETLDQFKITYELDSDPEYVLIKRLVPEYEREFLWEHTHELRKRRYASKTQQRSTKDDLRKKDIEKDIEKDQRPRSSPNRTGKRSKNRAKASSKKRNRDIERHDSVDTGPVALSEDDWSTIISDDGTEEVSYIAKSPSTKEDAARNARYARDEERYRRQDRHMEINNQNGDIKWFWLSQTDILPCFWATTWRSFTDLNTQVCRGATNVILEAIISIIGEAGVCYIDADDWRSNRSLTGTFNWMLAGKVTFPAYAYDARCGIVCTGTYTAMKCLLFAQTIPAVEHLEPYSPLHHSHENKPQAVCQRQIVGLMRLDSWLSIVGRMSEIDKGPSGLLKQMPALVQALMEEFELDFHHADLSSQDGGEQTNQETAFSVIDFLKDSGLTEAEVLYALVAVLRTVKVGQCILSGPDTRMLIEILEKDVQVYLV